jgi:hypothetical protein
MNFIHIREDLNHNIGNLRAACGYDRETWMVPSSRISLHIREDMNHNIGNLRAAFGPRQRNLDGSIFTDFSHAFVKTGS